MSEDKKSGRWRVVDFISPMGAVRRAVNSVTNTTGSIKQTVVSMKSSLPDQALPGDFPEGDVRNISDSKERFIAMYELHQWNEIELAKQTRVLKITKITALCISIFSLAGIAALAITTPLWLAIFLIPASGSLLILGFAQAFKYALYEAQVQMRDFISAKQFVGRDDFWKRFLG